MRAKGKTNGALHCSHVFSCDHTTFDLVNNLVGILHIIFNVFLYTVVVFLVNGKMNE